MNSISFLTTMVITINIQGKTDQDDSERCINNLDQELPFPSEWEGFFKNGTNKLQLVNLLVDLIKDSAVGKDVFVNRGNDCYFRQNN